jgi:hypothetical protein
MPFHKDKPYRLYLAPFHPPIYEQAGHFFYPDGSEVPTEVAKRILDYVDELCAKWGIPVNEHKKRWLPRTAREHDELRRHYWKK